MLLQAQGHQYGSLAVAEGGGEAPRQVGCSQRGEEIQDEVMIHQVGGVRLGRVGGWVGGRVVRWVGGWAGG